MKGGKIHGLALIDRRIDSVQQARSCDILFVSTSEDDDLGRDLDELHDAPVLTVSDIPDFVTRGGIVQFVLVGNRVRFEVNLSSAQRARLTLSSQLLKVALAVRGHNSKK